MKQPITMADAAELGVPECFSEEFAFHERNGTLPPYAGPVEPDLGSDAYDPYMDERFEPDDEETPPSMPVPLQAVEIFNPHMPDCDGTCNFGYSDGCPPF